MERGLKDFLFLSSPKQRCIKTLEPIAALVNRSVQVEPLLNEHETGEDYGDFSKRAERVYKAFLASETSWVCCSHGDWIPEFVETVLGLSVSIKKSGVLVLVLSPEGQLRLGEI